MGIKGYSKVSGVWKELFGTYVNVSSTWKRVLRTWVKVSGVWKRGGQGMYVPAGTILPFVGTVVPAGFSRYTELDDRFPIGAGSTYTAGNAGGSLTHLFSGNTNNLGSHTGTLFDAVSGSSTGGSNYVGETSAGAHSHAYSKTLTIADLYKTFMYIKADTEALIPDGAAIMAHQDISVDNPDFSEIETGISRFPLGATSYGTLSGDATPSGTVTTGTSGAHRHYTTVRYVRSSTNTTYYNNSAGGHSHTLTINVTLNTKYKRLQFLTSPIVSGVGTGAIIMSESSVAPFGWAVCDGTNGTPDMRDFFLKIGDSTTRNTFGGDNLAAHSYSSSSAGAHQHRGAVYGAPSYRWSIPHSNTTNSHTHNWSGSAFTLLQPYKALTFMMRIV